MTTDASARTAHESLASTAYLPADPTQSLRDSLEAFQARVKAGASALKAVHKAVCGLLDRKGLEFGTIETHLESLATAKLDDLELARDRDALVGMLQAHEARRRAALRLSLMGSLQRSVAADGLEMSRVGDSPPVVLIEPITIRLDFEADRADLLYAREVVRHCPLRTEAIVEARRQAMDQIRARAVDSESFFESLRRAYAMVLAAKGLSFGERVELVDLLAPLALLDAGVDRWRKLNLAKTATYERYQLAYQLQRLRRGRLLERDGLRLDLGAATGGTTRNKRNVLFVPQAGGEGQYYLSLRFLKAR